MWFIISALDQRVNHLLHHSVRCTTQKTYEHGLKTYKRFCNNYDLVPFPPRESTILRYIAHLDILNLRSQTVKVYIASLDHYCALYDFNKPSSFQRVKLMLRAISIKDRPRNAKLPITTDILTLMKPLVLDSSLDGYMYWAAMLTAHFGLLRVSEFTVNSVFDNNYHISRDAVLITPDRIKLFIPRSKTDVKNQGFTLSFACNSTNICPFCALKLYLSESPNYKNVPLFTLASGVPLSRSLFVEKTKSILSSLGMDKRSYSSHSYRSGGATSAAKVGLKDWELKQLGRWKSDTYQSYIKPSEQLLEKLRTRLVSSHKDRDIYEFRW